MNNPHIIVGEGRRCICGSYGTDSNNLQAIGCAEVLEALEQLKSPNHDAVAISRNAEIVSQVIRPLIQECD